MKFLEQATLRVASAFNDQLLRLLILEGMAGVPPKTWAMTAGPAGATGAISVGLQEAQANLPDLPPEWFSRKDQGLYSRAMRSIRKLPDDMAMEVMSAFMTGLSVITGQVSKTSEPHKIGQMMKSEGNYALDRASGLVARNLIHRAGDLARKIRTEKPRQQGLTYDDGEDREFDGGHDDQVSSSPLAMLYKLLTNPGTQATTYAAIRNFLVKNQWRNAPSKIRVFDVMVANPNWDARRIARELDIEDSYVSRVKRELQKTMPEVIEDLKKSPLFDWQSDRESLSELGFGQQRALYANNNNNARNLLKLLEEVGVFDRVRLAAAVWTAKKITAEDVREKAQIYWSPRQQAYDPTMMGHSLAKTLAPLLYSSFLFDLAPKFYHSSWNKGYAERIKKMILASGHKHAENIARNVTRNIFSTYVGSQQPSQYWDVKYSYYLKELQDFAKSGGSPAAPTLESEGLSDVANVVREYLQNVEKIRVVTENMVKRSVISGLKEMGIDASLIGTIDD